MRKLYGILLVFISLTSQAQKREIHSFLNEEIKNWNNGDMKSFMDSYWNSDSVSLIGKSGIIHGWQNIKNVYSKSFPDSLYMGALTYDIYTVKMISPVYCYVTGKFNVVRTKGNFSGYFDILLHKIKDKWYIISDHSS